MRLIRQRFYFMETKIKTWLADIKQAIAEIKEFIPSEKDFLLYQKDLKAKRATERNIEIIGEARSRILKLNPDFPLKSARKIVATRNRIIHGYDTVSEEILWSIIIKDLPRLEKEIDLLLNKKS